MSAIPQPRLITVEHSVRISHSLQRVTFSSQDFNGFSSLDNGAHIKLFFPLAHQTIPLIPYRDDQGKICWPEGDRPIVRTYSVRQFDEQHQQLIIDFVRHAEYGAAADWATRAQKGDVIGLAGPGGPQRFNADADYFVLIGDLSALPALAASLEALPIDAIGQAFILIEHEQDELDLFTPPNIQVHWVYDHQDFISQMMHQLDQLNWQQHISVTLAGENAFVIALRRYLRIEKKLSKADLYAVPYWRIGFTEETYHDERHRVMDHEDS